MIDFVVEIIDLNHLDRFDVLELISCLFFQFN